MTVMTLEEQLYQELCNAAKAGDVALVKTLIAARAPLNPPRSLTRLTTPLEHAIALAHVPLITLLIHKKADLKRSRQGLTSLGSAARQAIAAQHKGDDAQQTIEVFTLLAEAGAPWKPESTLDAPDEPYLFERWMEMTKQSHPEILADLADIMKRVEALQRKDHLEHSWEAAPAASPPTPIPRAPRF